MLFTCEMFNDNLIIIISVGNSSSIFSVITVTTAVVLDRRPAADLKRISEDLIFGRVCQLGGLVVTCVET